MSSDKATTTVMDKAQFMDFISHFIVARRGMYGVPRHVLEAAFDSYCQDGSLEPLLQYEKALHFSWNAGAPPRDDNDLMRQYMYPQSLLDWMHDFLDGKTFWQPEQIFDEKTTSLVRNYLSSGLLTNEAYDARRASYPVRRQEACAAISNPKLRAAVFKRDGHRCRHCRATNNLSIDHIIAVANGGDNSMGNFQTLCRSCNSAKGARS